MPFPLQKAISVTKSAKTERCWTGTRWSDISRSWQKSSDRIRVEELGKSTEGRPFIAATIADADTLKHLDRYIEIQRRLADPRTTPPAEAEKLFLEGKAVVLITCSIHATEIASTHTAVEFAYRLLTEDNPHYRAILDNTIVLLVPSLNPDGVDIVTRWYRKTLGTPFEGTSRRSFTTTTWATTTIATGTSSRRWKRGSPSPSCTTCGIRRLSTMSTSRAPTRRGFSCRHGSTPPSRTSTPS